MPKRKKANYPEIIDSEDVDVTKRVPRMRPALDPLAREKQLESLAVDLAEKQLIDGTASPSVITHYLKLASTREQIERDMLVAQAALVTAKAQSIETSTANDNSAKEALAAMKSYAPSNADQHE